MKKAKDHKNQLSNSKRKRRRLALELKTRKSRSTRIREVQRKLSVRSLVFSTMG